MRKFWCPQCGKELVNLNVDDESISDFWCDDCDIDISITENKKTHRDE